MRFFSLVPSPINSSLPTLPTLPTLKQVIRTGQYSEETDVFSSLVLLWEVCTGGIPHEGLDESQVLDGMGWAGIGLDQIGLIDD